MNQNHCFMEGTARYNPPRTETIIPWPHVKIPEFLLNRAGLLELEKSPNFKAGRDVLNLISAYLGLGDKGDLTDSEFHSIMDTQRTRKESSPPTEQNPKFTYRQSTENNYTHQHHSQAKSRFHHPQKHETSHADGHRENTAVPRGDKTNLLKKITLQKQNRPLLLVSVLAFFLGLIFLVASPPLAAFTGLSAAIFSGVGIGATVVSLFAMWSYLLRLEKGSFKTVTVHSPAPASTLTKKRQKCPDNLHNPDKNPSPKQDKESRPESKT